MRKKVVGLLVACGLFGGFAKGDYLNPEDIKLIINVALDASPIINDLSSLESKVDIHLKIDLVEKSIIRNRIKLLKTRGYKRILSHLQRGKKYIPLIKEIFSKYQIPDEFIFLPIIESHFTVDIVSPAGAGGLWQFMPKTGRNYGLRINQWIDERFDVEKSTIAAAKYLKDLYSIFDDWSLALASYNSGEGTIIRRINKYGGEDFWDIDEYLSKETRNYVPNFLATVVVVREILEKEKFDYSHMDFDILKVDKPVSLAYISAITGIPLEKLMDMNPHLIKGVIPPFGDNYNIYLPKGFKQTVEGALAKSPIKKYPVLLGYRVKKGDTLQSIANRFGTTVEYLKRINHIRGNYVAVGRLLKIPSFIEAYPYYYNGVIDLSRVKEPKIVKRDVKYLKRIVKKRKPTYRYIRYTVRKGDSLIKIAKRFGTSVSQIKRWNNIKGNIIRPGQKIQIVKRINGR
ncbi:MAG: LysM peptidoglycan-binding domain-containing protein [Aquificae bacterium]|nr:LysM peptidoglycan-binding domain-containing protein [Aquificota bacterium]